MIKQVIVIRKDLKMRRGKEIAQGSHASMMFIVNRIKQNGRLNAGTTWDSFSGNERIWMEGKFTKICLAVDSESQLDELYDRAKSLNIIAHMCVDSGVTEFDGVPTKTCIAIGPDDSEKIDAITGELKLY